MSFLIISMIWKSSLRARRRLSFLSRATVFLSTICFFPVTVNMNNSQAHFSFFSFKTSIYFVVFVCGGLIIIGVFIPFYPDLYTDFLTVFFTVNNYVDIVSLIFFFSSLYLVIPLSSLILASSFPHLTPLSLHHNLKTPRNWVSLFLMIFSTFLGSLLIVVGIYLGMMDRMNKDRSLVSSEMIAYIVAPYASILFPQLSWCISVILASLWISQYCELCSSVPDQDLLPWARNCFLLYNSIEEHLGSFLCFVFSLSQVFWIFTLYVGVTGYFSNYSMTSTVCYSAGMGLYSLGILANVVGFSALLETAHQALHNIIPTLQDHSMGVEDTKHMLRLSYTLRDIERARPITGKGLFQIDRSLVTGMVSVAVTYIIILAQFRISLD